MSLIIKVSIVLCLTTITFEATEAVKHSFETLPKASSGEFIAIRGFLYLNDNKEIILASEPNLKSCCLGKRDQITVEGISTSSLVKNVTTIEGVIEKSPRGYVLKESKIIHQENSIGVVILYTTAALLIVGIGFWKFFF